MPSSSSLLNYLANTGGASGFGLATTELIVKKGGYVAILDVNEEKGENAVKQFGTEVSFLLVFSNNLADPLFLFYSENFLRQSRRARGRSNSCSYRNL